MAQANLDSDKFLEFLDEVIPQFSRLFDRETIETIAKQPPSFLPRFRYVGPRLYQGKRTVLLGDCAHTVKPYFGMGANSALEDVKVRSSILL
jgi:2-polyprenyl-6-methoxyphenol hydroxylase-like FAD-dependent oxidoreductase